MIAIHALYLYSNINKIFHSEDKYLCFMSNCLKCITSDLITLKIILIICFLTICQENSGKSSEKII